MLSKIIFKIKSLAQPFLWPIYKFYMSRPRWYNFQQISVLVLPSVFHPQVFISTKVLLHYLLRFELSGKKLLELGAGSGLISLVASQRGALVTSSDINPEAIAGLRESYQKNNLHGLTIVSDLFDQLPRQEFDFIVINPPYFPKTANNFLEMAFYCGPNYEYYRKLFHQLPSYLAINTTALMILNETCDRKTIVALSHEAQLKFELKWTINRYGEKQYIYQIRKDQVQ